MPLSCHLHPALKVHIYVVIFLSSSCYAPTFHCTDLLYSFHIWAYIPFFSSNVSWVPSSVILPSFKTQIRSASTIEDRRWAIIITVLPLDSLENASCTFASLSGSAKAVASSKIRIGAFFNMALAMESRWASSTGYIGSAASDYCINSIRKFCNDIFTLGFL